MVFCFRIVWRPLACVCDWPRMNCDVPLPRLTLVSPNSFAPLDGPALSSMNGERLGVGSLSFVLPIPDPNLILDVSCGSNMDLYGGEINGYVVIPFSPIGIFVEVNFPEVLGNALTPPTLTDPPPKEKVASSPAPRLREVGSKLTGCFSTPGIIWLRP